MGIYSSKEELEKIANAIIKYFNAPFSRENVPGPVLEEIIEECKGWPALGGIDFVDNLSPNGNCGVQCKSGSTRRWSLEKNKWLFRQRPWGRITIPLSKRILIDESYINPILLQELGDSVIDTFNDKIKFSIEKYNLDEIGYIGLVFNPNSTFQYYERSICLRNNPILFDKKDFRWEWSIPKKETDSPVLKGINIKTNQVWVRWKAHGDTQLDFMGAEFWVTDDSLRLTFTAKNDGKDYYLDNLNIIENLNISSNKVRRKNKISDFYI